jgi:penicillin-insensitive murein endopeptidase
VRFCRNILETVDVSALKYLVLVVFFVQPAAELSAAGPGEETSWQLPPLPFDSEPIDVSPQKSLSVGSVTEGRLYNAVRIDLPRPHLSIAATQRERGLNYTTARLADAIQTAADYTARNDSGRTTYLGNASAKYGGDIPYSVSHNSGRDIDVVFFAEDKRGEQVIPTDLITFDANGEATSDGKRIYFDVSANWWFVEGLLEKSDVALEFIFVSEALKAKLLDYARANNRPASVIQRAARILHQPSNAPPHADHFHIRIHCTRREVTAGCRDIGRTPPRKLSNRSIRQKTTKRLLQTLGTEGTAPGEKVSALRQLTRLTPIEELDVVARQLEVQSSAVRLHAVRLLGANHSNLDDLTSRLRREKNPFVLSEILHALQAFKADKVAPIVRWQLQNPRKLRVSEGYNTTTDALLIQSLIELEARSTIPLLINELLETSSTPRARILVRGLRYLANWQVLPGPLHRFNSPRIAAQRWSRWLSGRAHSSIDHQWQKAFGRHDYDVDTNQTLRRWELCKAVGDRDYISYNAQRWLMTLSGKSPNSLEWSKIDAQHYWTRWAVRHMTPRELNPAVTFNKTYRTP